MFSRGAPSSRRTRSLVSILVAGAFTLAALGITPSLASWTRVEYANGPVGTLDCAATGTLNTQASGQLIAGEVAGAPLTGNLAAVVPLTVSNTAPATTSSPSGASPATSKTNDAWVSALNVQALNSVNITPTVQLPLSSTLTAGTQYGRATSAGIATGASGAVTGAGDGTVSFQPAASATPIGTLDLGTALTSVVGAQLSSDVTQLSDASLAVGAVGSISDEENGCQNVWQGIQNSAASVARSYVLAALKLNLTSSLVGRTTTAIGNSVTALGTTLNALEPTGSLLNTATVDPTTHTSVTGALTTLLGVTAIIPGVNVGVLTSPAPTAVVGVTFNLGSIASLLTGTVGSGAVSINLGTGVVSVDLAQLLGKTDLNALSANSSLLTTANVNSILAGITGTIGTLIDTTVNNAVKALLVSAAVTVSVNTDIGVTASLLSLDALHADIELSGTLGDFVDQAHNVAPTVHSTVTVLPSAGALTAIANSLITPVTNLLTATAVLGSLLPIVDDLVLNTVNSTATAALATALSTLDGTPITTIETAFGTVLTVIRNAVSLVVNAQPDQPGGVGTPDGSLSTPGRFFDSALAVGVVNKGGTPVLGFYFGSSSAGPVTVR